MKYLYIVICILLLLFLTYRLTKRTESFGWNCQFTPPEDYYKDPSILGGNVVAEAMARDAIVNKYHHR